MTKHFAMQKCTEPKKKYPFFAWFVGLLTDRSGAGPYDLLHQRIASAFSPGHDSPSNDRFSPHARFAPCMETILSKHSYFGKSAPLSFIRSRFFPCPGFSPDSLVQRTSMRVQAFPASLSPRLPPLGSRMCHKSHRIFLVK